MTRREIRVVQRTGSAAQWESRNPVLLQGEIGHDVTNGEIRVGDGETPWNGLTPIAAGSGTPGASAYDIAVANGFSGTEEEWLESLVGADGAPGAPGSIGPAGPSVLTTTAWYKSGDVALWVFGAPLVLPPYGVVELIGASLAVQAVGIGTSGLTRVRFTADSTPIGELTLAHNSLRTTEYYKTSPDAGKRIFLSVPALTPEALIRAEITTIPSGGTQLPQNLTVTLWWRWSAS